jgi:hypothetical protein
VTAKPEVNIGSSRRGPIMTLSETPSKEQPENGTTYQTPQLGPAPIEEFRANLQQQVNHANQCK